MSKVEKALKRARAERKFALVPVRNAPSSTDDVSLRLPAGAGSDGAAGELEARVHSSGAIALMRENQVRSRSELEAKRVIYPEMPENAVTDAFRAIRTRILQKTLKRNCVIMVSSAVPESGNTFVATNLAAAFAFDAGMTALLVDCNLRKPKLHEMLFENAARGLTDYLENSEIDISQIIYSAGIERLRVIPAGGRREIPGEYFTTVRMKRLLENVRLRYAERFIIIDAPPMIETADTQILAELCDYVLLNVPYGKVTDSQIERCLKAVDTKKLLGVVFNEEPRVAPIRWGGIAHDSWAIVHAWLNRHAAFLMKFLRKNSGSAGNRAD